jgi:hypothetical protein
MAHGKDEDVCHCITPKNTLLHIKIVTIYYIMSSAKFHFELRVKWELH